ncbi:hypothetical protein [Coleofasciculus sp. LEGE 07092]|nr:hypothetical protein [Coleofasciculus sp. LEGE 07092]MBE9149160.1 hypothetical protein [Coleofasciculus sp. LEGE 07092]
MYCSSPIPVQSVIGVTLSPVRKSQVFSTTQMPPQLEDAIASASVR